MDSDAAKPHETTAALHERLGILETELKGLRGTLSALAQFGGLSLGLVAITFGWNAISERQGLRELERDIKKEVQVALGKVAEEPELDIAVPGGKPLDGAIVEPTITTTDNVLHIVTPIVISNRGRGWSGPAAIKTYTGPAIPQKNSSTDEPAFAFEDNWVGSTKETGLYDIPGGFSYSFNLAIYPTGAAIIAPGRYPCLLKIFYGKGKVIRVNYTLWIKNQIQSAPSPAPDAQPKR